MCDHRPQGRWARTWSGFLVSVLVVGVALEGAGMVTTGTEGTLTTYMQHLAGTKPRCRHVYLGRLTLIAFFSWVVAHVGWDVLGCDLHVHRRPRCSVG